MFANCWTNLAHLCLSVPSCCLGPVIADCKSINTSLLLDHGIQANIWGLSWLSVSTHFCSVLSLHIPPWVSVNKLLGLNLKGIDLVWTLIAISKDHSESRGRSLLIFHRECRFSKFSELQKFASKCSNCVF